jgi:hypothetical protein
MFIINTSDGPIDIDDPEVRQLCYNKMMNKVLKEKKVKTIEIEIQDNKDEWHEVKIEIIAEDWMDSIDVETEITRKAILWASDNGLSYHNWEIL